MQQSESPEERQVSAIRHGTAIDHIDSEVTFTVADILQVQLESSMVLVGMNLESKKLGRKGIIKIENRELTPEEVNKIAVVAPNATLNIISDYKVVEKFKVELPERIAGFVKCFNPRCVTNQQEMLTRFDVIADNPPALRCEYCERVMRGKDVLIK